jgi:hypothetical protein
VFREQFKGLGKHTGQHSGRNHGKSWWQAKGKSEAQIMKV